MYNSNKLMNIPDFIEPDWDQVYSKKVIPNADPLIQIHDSENIKIYPIYYHLHIPDASPILLLRKAVYEKLRLASASLPDNIGLILLDGWRSTAVQTNIRLDIKKQIIRDNQHLPEQELQQILNRYVAEPSQDITAPSPHLTGGSIDLSLFWLDTGEIIDMGSEFDCPHPVSWTDSFNHIPNSQAKKYRQILYTAMISVGFTNLSTEWWHFDYGNQLWAYYANQDVAFYSVATPNNALLSAEVQVLST